MFCLNPSSPFTRHLISDQTKKEENNSLSYTLRGESSCRLLSGFSDEDHPSAGTALPILLRTTLRMMMMMMIRVMRVMGVRFSVLILTMTTDLMRTKMCVDISS